MINTMEIYRQKETYRRELLKHVFYMDVAGIQALLDMQNPFGDFDFTYGITQVREVVDKDMMMKEPMPGKMTIEDVIHYTYMCTSKWCHLESSMEALGEIIVYLWNAGFRIRMPVTISFIAFTDIPLTSIRNLDELFSSSTFLDTYLKHWYPTQEDLDTLMSLEVVSDHLDMFLESIVDGRFNANDKGQLRNGMLPWSDVYRQVLEAGANPSSALKRKHEDFLRRYPTIEEEGDIFETHRLKRPRIA